LLTALTPARVALRISGLAIPVTCAISVKLTPGRSSITPSMPPCSDRARLAQPIQPTLKSSAPDRRGYAAARACRRPPTLATRRSGAVARIGT
jgi:hypothetical protein